MKKLILLSVILIAMSCTKDEFPYQALNVKAVDCTYSINDTDVSFTYVSNETDSNSNKRAMISGTCKVSNIKEYNDHYLWMDTCMIYSKGYSHMQ